MSSGDDKDNNSGDYDDLDMDALELDSDLQDADISYDADDSGLEDVLDEADYNDDDLADFDEAPARAARGRKQGRGAVSGGVNRKLLLGVAGVAVLAAGAFFMLGGSGDNTAPRPQAPQSSEQARSYDEAMSDITLMDGLPQPPGAVNDANAYPDLSEPSMAGGDPLMQAADGALTPLPADVSESLPQNTGAPDFPPPPALEDNVAEAVDIGMGDAMNDAQAALAPTADAPPVTETPVTEMPAIEETSAVQIPDIYATPDMPPVVNAPAPDEAALQSVDEQMMSYGGPSVATVPSVPMGTAAASPQGALPITSQPVAPDAVAQNVADGASVPSATPTPLPDPSGAAPSVPMASGGYYEAGPANLPRAELAGSVGPRQVDPAIEPAQRYVIVDSVQVASDPESKLEAASRALKLGRYDAALEMYDALYARNSRDARILMGRAVAQQNTGRTESAIRSYEEVLDRDPKNTEAMINMLGLIRNQYPEVALRRMMDLTAEHPDNAGLAAQIGVIQGEMGNYRDGIRFLNRAAQLEPNNPQHFFNMAVIADREGVAREAVQYYEQALSVDSVYGSGRSLPRETIYKRLSVLRARL